MSFYLYVCSSLFASVIFFYKSTLYKKKITDDSLATDEDFTTPIFALLSYDVRTPREGVDEEWISPAGCAPLTHPSGSPV